MKKNVGFLTEEKESRRGILKKIGTASAFSIPVITSFRLSELQASVSGGTQQTDIERAWDTYWSQNDLFFNWPQSVWSENKEGWYSIWQLLQ